MRIFSASGGKSWLRLDRRRPTEALFPGVAELADQVEGAGDEDGVISVGVGEGAVERLFGIGNGGEM